MRAQDASLGPLARHDIAPLARLHRRSFPGFFLSRLGEPFLVQFYLGFLQDSSAVTVVARDHVGSVVGAAVGTTEPAGFFRRLLIHRWPGFAAASARAVLRQPTAIPRLVRAVTYRGAAPPRAGGALLSSICVDPSAQGTGVGRQLLAAWERAAQQKGARRAFLTTDAESNQAVNDFYAARGWRLEESFVTREGRSMNCYTKRLDED